MLNVFGWCRLFEDRLSKRHERIGAGSLRQRLEDSNRLIKSYIRKLDALLIRFQNRDQMLFDRIIATVRRKNMDEAAVLANEVVQVRKISKMLIQSKVAFEQVEIRIETVKELGDITTVLKATNTVVNNITNEFDTIISAAEASCNEMNEMRGSLLIENNMSGIGINVFSTDIEFADEEVERVYNEAASAAEQRTKQEPNEITPPLRQEVTELVSA